MQMWGLSVRNEMSSNPSIKVDVAKSCRAGYDKN